MNNHSVVTGVGATAGAVGAGVAKGGKALAGAAKLFVKGISRRTARLAEDDEGGDAEGVDSIRRYLLLLNKR